MTSWQVFSSFHTRENFSTPRIFCALLNLQTFHTSMNASWCINQMLVIMTVFIWQIDNLTSFLEFSCSRKLVNSTHLLRSLKFANLSYLNERKLMYKPDVSDNDSLYLTNWQFDKFSRVFLLEKTCQLHASSALS